MGKGYHEVIELEYLNDFLKGNGNEFIAAVLLFVADKLNHKKEFFNLYRFEVISFGFMGYYPAIGVIYLKEKLHDIADSVTNQFEEIIASHTLKEFDDFGKEYIIMLERIVKQVKKDNDDFYSRMGKG